MADDTSSGRNPRKKRKQPGRRPRPPGQQCDSHAAEAAKWKRYSDRLKIRFFYWPQALFYSLLFAAAFSTTAATGAALAKAAELSPVLLLFVWAAASLAIFLFVVCDTFLKFGVAGTLIAQVRSEFATETTCRMCVAGQRQREEQKVLRIIEKLENGGDLIVIGKQ